MKCRVLPDGPLPVMLLQQQVRMDSTISRMLIMLSSNSINNTSSSSSTSREVNRGCLSIIDDVAVDLGSQKGSGSGLGRWVGGWYGLVRYKIHIALSMRMIMIVFTHFTQVTCTLTCHACAMLKHKTLPCHFPIHTYRASHRAASTAAALVGLYLDHCRILAPYR